MRFDDTHPSDQDLIMAADGELSTGRAAQISAHLAACGWCRERSRSVENTMALFMRARNSELANHVPAATGPRALLRARLAQEAQVRQPVSIWRVTAAAIACAALLATILLVFGSTVSAEGPKPLASVTPGETRPVTVAEVCRNLHVDVEIPEETRRRVFLLYGIRSNAENYEVDYLITPDLGGAQSLRNLWPQPYSARWNAHVKDRLEQRLHELVCDGKVDLRTAQREIAGDWIRAYKKYFGTTVPD